VGVVVASLAAVFCLTTSSGQVAASGPADRVAVPPQAPPSDSDTATARRWIDRLGRIVPTRFVARASERFLLVSDLHEADAADALQRLERTANAIEGFARELDLPERTQKEDARLVGIAFRERRAFERFASEEDRVDASWMVGYWVPGADRIVFRREGNAVAATRALHMERTGEGAVLASTSEPIAVTVAHEAAHQLLHRLGVQRRGLRSPLAVAEGLAIAFERCAIDGGEPFAIQPEREERVADAIAAGTLPALSALVATPRLLSTDPGAIERFYDASYSLIRHLRTSRFDDFAEYLRLLRDEAATLSGRRNKELFEGCFGPIEKVEQAWHRSVRQSGKRTRPT
jgi:hypothetical protein